MFYTTDSNAHGLPHNPFKAIVSPRPIGWISTLNADGSANLAPYSFFNAINDAPPMVLFSAGFTKIGLDEPKDSFTNAKNNGEFTVNIVGEAQTDAMNTSSAHYPAGTDEFEKARLAKGEGRTVSCPFVLEAPAALECKLWKIVELPGGKNTLVIGEVTGIHINDAMLNEGRYDVARARHLSRLGYRDYATITDPFELKRPGQ